MVLTVNKSIIGHIVCFYYVRPIILHMEQHWHYFYYTSITICLLKDCEKKNHGTLLRLEEFLLKKLIRHPQTRRVFLCWCTADHATMRPPLAHSPHEQWLNDYINSERYELMTMNIMIKLKKVNKLYHFFFSKVKVNRFKWWMFWV